MEYLLYILAILLLGLLCLACIRFASQSTFRKPGVTKRKVDRLAQPAARPVPTPWGWANHRERNGAAATPLSQAMQDFTSRLMREKKLASTRSLNPRLNGSMRALLEDRYARVDRSAVKYEKVKRPLLRDPSQPHDQMDNFGTREAERIRARLQHIKSMNQDALPDSRAKRVRYVEIKDIKKPWGW